MELACCSDTIGISFQIRWSDSFLKCSTSIVLLEKVDVKDSRKMQANCCIVGRKSRSRRSQMGFKHFTNPFFQSQGFPFFRKVMFQSTNSMSIDEIIYAELLEATVLNIVVKDGPAKSNLSRLTTKCNFFYATLTT